MGFRRSLPGGCGCEATIGKGCHVWHWVQWRHGLLCGCSLSGISHLGRLCNSAGRVHVLSGTFCPQQAGRLLWTEATRACPSLCPCSVLALGQSLQATAAGPGGLSELDQGLPAPLGSQANVRAEKLRKCPLVQTSHCGK